MFSHVTQWVRPDYDKKLENVPRQHLLTHFMQKIVQNIGKFPYFHKNRDISKSRKFLQVELGKCFKAQNWNIGTF